jgi:nitronate monooxygenase
MRTSFQDMLGTPLPLVQGPFGGGLSTVELAGSVSELGGLGSYGCYHLDGAGIADIAARLSARTSAPFALNLWVRDHDAGGTDMSEDRFESAWAIYAPYFAELGIAKPARPVRYHNNFGDQIDALLAARPAAFSFVFGIPDLAVLAECRRLGIVSIGAATTPAEVAALDAANVDAILATGFEAGGHRPSFLDTAENSLMGTLALVRASRRLTSRPIIAAGGIADGEAVGAILAAGADAAQIGTAFLACTESGATDLHRAVLFSERAGRTVLTRAYSGRLARGIPNRVIAEFDNRPDLPPFPIHGWFLGKLKAAAAARELEDFQSLYAGQGAAVLRHKRVGDLVTAIRQSLNRQGVTA